MTDLERKVLHLRGSLIGDAVQGRSLTIGGVSAERILEILEIVAESLARLENASEAR